MHPFPLSPPANRGTPTHRREQVPQRSAPWAHRRPTPHSTCRGASLSAGRGSRGWAGARPCCRGARSPPPRPGRCTGTCSCSGRTPRSGTPCRRRHTGRRPELRGQEAEGVRLSPGRRDPRPRPPVPVPTHRCRRRSCGWRGSRSRRRAPCGGRRGRARCTARPAAWRTPGSSRSRRAPGRRRRGSWGRARLRTGTARCTPAHGPRPAPAAGGEKETAAVSTADAVPGVARGSSSSGGGTYRAEDGNEEEEGGGEAGRGHPEAAARRGPGGALPFGGAAAGGV